MEKILPKGWEKVRLGEVCLINPPKPEIPSENNVAFLPMDAISADGDIQYMETRQYKEVKNGYTGFVENDVLFAKITPCMENGKGTIAKGLLNSIGFGSTEFHVIRASEKILPEIIFRYLSLKNIRKIAEVNMVGSAGQKRVPQSFLNTLKIPLPPLPTQHRIVEILEKADSLRKLRQKADEKMKDLIPSLFVQMFGDPATDPKRWPLFPISELCEGKYGIKAGPFGSSLKKNSYTTSGYRVYGQEQVISGDFSFGNYYISKEKFKLMIAYQVKLGDLLISLVGTIGKVAIVPKYIEPGIINPRLLKITPKNEVLNSVFLAELIQHPSTQSSLNNVAHGGTMGVLNAGLLKKLSIPLPPLPLQQEFAERVKEIEAEKERQAEGRKKLGELFNSLMQRAFKGELVA